MDELSLRIAAALIRQIGPHPFSLLLAHDLRPVQEGLTFRAALSIDGDKKTVVDVYIFLNQLDFSDLQVVDKAGKTLESWDNLNKEQVPEVLTDLALNPLL